MHRPQDIARIAYKEEKLILGLMSGTSNDGLDMALCRVQGHGIATRVEMMHFCTHHYSSSTRNALIELCGQSTISAKALTEWNAKLARIHSQYINEQLDLWGITPAQIDLIASHGHTIYHLSSGGASATLQIGDGDIIAHSTGIVTVSDFRMKHIAAGGQGAPLAPYGDRLMCHSAKEDRILINIGGISNYTYLPAMDQGTHAVIASDTGPGNTLLDRYVRRHYNLTYDAEGKIARGGTANDTVLQALLAHPFFKKEGSKSCGPENFTDDWLAACIAQGPDDLPPADILATLTKLTAHTIVDMIRPLIDAPAKTGIYLSGGGVHNTFLVDSIQQLLPASIAVQSTHVLGLPPDAKEAILFAVLANESLSGAPLIVESRQVRLGKISL